MEFNLANIICSAVFGICTGGICAYIASNRNKGQIFLLVFAAVLFSAAGALYVPLSYPSVTAAIIIILFLQKVDIVEAASSALISAASSFAVIMFAVAVTSPCVEAYSYTMREMFYYHAMQDKNFAAVSAVAALSVIFITVWMCRSYEDTGNRAAVWVTALSLAAAVIMLLHMCAGWIIDYNAKCFKTPVLFSVLNSSIALLCVMVAGIFASKLKKSIYIPNRPGDIKGLYLILASILCTILFYCYENNIINNYTTFDNPRYKYTVSILIVLMIVTILAALIAVCTYMLRVREEKSNIERQIELTGMYRNEIKNIRNEIFDFKHDYVKIYSSMSKFIINKEYDKLHDFFDKNIIPLQKELINSDEDSKNILMIEDEAVQGLIYSYIIKAKREGVNLIIDIRDNIPISSVPVIDLNRLLGIFLDNAIEHAQHCDKTVCFAAVKRDDCIMFVITNSSEGVDTEKIFCCGESTKGKGRGRGLSIARRICASHDKLSMHTYLKNGKFVCEVYIEED